MTTDIILSSTLHVLHAQPRLGVFASWTGFTTGFISTGRSGIQRTGQSRRSVSHLPNSVPAFLNPRLATTLSHLAFPLPTHPKVMAPPSSSSASPPDHLCIIPTTVPHYLMFNSRWDDRVTDIIPVRERIYQSNWPQHMQGSVVTIPDLSKIVHPSTRALSLMLEELSPIRLGSIK